MDVHSYGPHLKQLFYWLSLIEIMFGRLTSKQTSLTQTTNEMQIPIKGTEAHPNFEGTFPLYIVAAHPMHLHSKHQR